MRTTLNLLTRDGTTYMAFEPVLSATQYARLIDITDRAATEEELRDAVTAWARAGWATDQPRRDVESVSLGGAAASKLDHLEKLNDYPAQPAMP